MVTILPTLLGTQRVPFEKQRNVRKASFPVVPLGSFLEQISGLRPDVKMVQSMRAYQLLTYMRCGVPIHLWIPTNPFLEAQGSPNQFLESLVP